MDQFWLLTRWEPGVNPENRSRDPAYVVAHVKLRLCTNFSRWPGGNPVEPGGPGRDPAYVVARVKLRPWTNFGSDPVHERYLTWVFRDIAEGEEEEEEEEEEETERFLEATFRGLKKIALISCIKN